jgi:GABA(A) receptor-associated protein
MLLQLLKSGCMTSIVKSMMNSVAALTPSQESGSFKQRFTFEQRITQSRKLSEQFQGYVFVIIEPSDLKATQKNLQELTENSNDEHKTFKTKFIVPEDNTLGQFLVRFRQQVSLKPDEAVFVFTDKRTLPSNAQTMKNLFLNNANEDGFLYLTYTKENTFGK